MIDPKKLKIAVSSILCVSVLASCTTTPEQTEAIDTTAVGETTEATMEVTQTPQIDGYNLLWSDEFDGNTLNEAI